MNASHFKGNEMRDGRGHEVKTGKTPPQGSYLNNRAATVAGAEKC